MTSINADPLRLVFGGGTALSRAHRLTERMSEDIDFKIVSDESPSRAELRKLRERVTESLLAAGFAFDPNDPNQRNSHNEGRHTIYRLPYPAEIQGNGALRPEIKIETSAWPARLKTVSFSVGSFLAEAFGEIAEVPEIACASLSETLAEKFIALTRRVGQSAATQDPVRDKTLVRHIYDLHVTRKHCDQKEIIELASQIVYAEVQAHGSKYPAYRSNPVLETLNAVDLISVDRRFAVEYSEFLRDMVYGKKPTFKSAVKSLQVLAQGLQFTFGAKS